MTDGGPTAKPPSRADVIGGIERLALSADAKALLAQIADTSTTVGGQIIYIGRRIIGFILDLLRSFPNTAFGLIAGFVVATLIASIPLVGALIGPLLTPLLLALGIAKGALADLQQGEIGQRVAMLEGELRAIEGGVA